MTPSAGWAAAAHLVRCMGFGASGDLVDAIAAAGPSSWLEASLRAAPESDSGAAETSAPFFETPRPLHQDAGRDDRQKRRQQETEKITQLVAWWIRRMVLRADPTRVLDTTPAPLGLIA